MINNFLEDKAEKLLVDAQFFSTPIKVMDIAKHLGAVVQAVELEPDVSGFLALNDGKVYIGYNTLDGEERRRFTIAHEIAHFILHAKKDNPLFIDKFQTSGQKKMFRNSNSSRGEYIQEIEANSFAAALLMPKKLIEAEIKELSDSEEDQMNSLIKKLAKKFKVSSQAMNIRLINLDIISYTDY